MMLVARMIAYALIAYATLALLLFQVLPVIAELVGRVIAALHRPADEPPVLITLARCDSCSRPVPSGAVTCAHCLSIPEGDSDV
ncbi:hypothetical protein [Streptomyces jumonjinensis]|uniref:Uncharacterized protein n=1 Tax=Streptomyces jumonjinensis TaxID=1945 RepID=A0A646KNS8_STRJU|nr:hypothetical protein [Streptomyces jumonjinensis]MQT03893.1 hypothetical protein [Streptomyces jumonjinensis]